MRKITELLKIQTLQNARRRLIANLSLMYFTDWTLTWAKLNIQITQYVYIEAVITHSENTLFA